ncbi:MAG: transcription elongation factor GreB [Gammaproteobacteria bacterium]|nr:transcription elongation factor GreB [Gammaproteobacteria bacterium]
MGRYRAPQKPGSFYITPEGHQSLTEELDYLWRVKRPKVTQSVSEAAAQGDRSENAEYIYGKKQLREIDWRVRFLRKRLDNLVIVDRAPDNPDKVHFGAWVKLSDEEDKEYTYRIVGPDEFDTNKGWISMDAPLAKALMTKSIGDEIQVDLPNGKNIFYIIEIKYNSI